MPMSRLPRNLFLALGLRMVIWGLLIGAAFPVFVNALGLPTRDTLTPLFWGASLTAGLLAGLASLLFAHRMVGPRLSLLAERMNYIRRAINTATYTGDWSDCTPERCHVPADSNDAVGNAARAFNDLVGALFRSHNTARAASEFSTILSSELELESLCDKALQLFTGHTGAIAGAVLAGPPNQLSVVAHRGLLAAEALAKCRHVQMALTSGRCEKIPVPGKVRFAAQTTDPPLRELIVVPALFDSKVPGTVVLATPGPFDPETEWLLELFRHSFGLALNNALVHDQLRQTAALDPLTRIYNRRFGMARLEEEFKRAHRTDNALGVLMVDLDHFKNINDQYGHLMGDRVLIAVTRRLKGEIRESDLLIRFGGEEFLIVLPGATPSDCQAFAERLRKAVNATPFREDGIELPLSASVGVTAYPALPVQTAEQLVDAADRALYEAKSDGRDRVVMACE
ncbi:GGDEF domain-containing protein [Thiohalomonas denitrificans]|uniref:GGDEF domain-containing protein n=1 Tax=Thiohalomonas denitrificans TaxID=415747 RepID=UPI0026E92D36|nr:GGDEF domain-containing protein [Thiohalomonas denitrificans]